MNEYILFCLWPLFSLITALINYSKKSSKNILWLFCIFYGYTLVIANNKMDISRYRDWFLLISRNPSTSFLDYFNLMETHFFGSDIFFPAVSYLVSRFTKDPRILFAIFGLIFGFFYSRNIWLLIARSGEKLKPFAIALIITFAFINPFWNINGFRFNAAFNIFLYGILRYFFEKKNVYLLFSACSVLMHFSFLFPLVVFLIYLKAGNRILIYFCLFLVTFFCGRFINPEYLREKRPIILPAAYETTIDYYISEPYVQVHNETEANLKWFLKWRGKALGFALLLLMGLAFIERKRRGIDDSYISLFSFSLLYSGIAHFFSNIPSFSRFITLGQALQIAVIFLFVNYTLKSKWMKIPFFLFFIASFWYCAVEMRIGFETISVETLFTNPLIAPFTEPSTSLVNLIK